MKKLIEQARKELVRRILAGEYELVKLQTYKGSDYICNVSIEIDGYPFKYTVAKTYACEHANEVLLNDKKEAIEHFINLYNEKFNTEEIKQAKIEELKKQIKDLES